MNEKHFDAASKAYLIAGLMIGKEIDGYVDAYHGPSTIEEEASNQSDIDSALDELDNQIAALPDSNRRAFLQTQARSMRTTVDVHRGTKLDYRDEVEATFDIRPEWTPEERFETAHVELDRLLPGDGPLRDRRAAHNKKFELNTDRVMPVIDGLREELRARTAAMIELPPGEEATIELVSDKPWSGYNWYLGKYRSLIEINTDLPIRANSLPDLVAHEIYSGHHTEHSLKERHWLTERGYGEAAIALLTSPQAVISEGIATTALDVVVPDSERARWVFEKCYEPAGIDADPETDLAVQKAGRELGGVTGNAALMLHDRGQPEEDIVAYLMQWGLRSEKEARQSVRFMTTPILRCYIFTYFVGQALVSKYLDRATDRDQAVHSLLTEHWTPGMLRDYDTGR